MMTLAFLKLPTRPILAASPPHWRCRDSEGKRVKKGHGSNRNVYLTQRKSRTGRRGGRQEGPSGGGGRSHRVTRGYVGWGGRERSREGRRSHWKEHTFSDIQQQHR